MPASALKVVQISSAEGTWGSTQAATIKLHGITDASLKSVDMVEIVPSAGMYGPGGAANTQAQSGEGRTSLTMTYEEAPRILNAFFTAIGQTTSTGAPYNYPYTAPVGSSQAVATYTMEYGTSGNAYRAPGSVGKHLNITGEAGGFWAGSVDWISKQIVAATSGLSSGPSDRTVTPIRMADTTLYVDAFSTATMGGSAVSATLIAFALDIETNRHLKQFAGSLYPASWGEGKWDGTLAITAEFNASAKAWVDEALGTTGATVSRQVRIGATEGSSASVKTFNLDFGGIKTGGETLFTDRDGNMTVALTFAGRYTTALSNWFLANVQNGSSSTT